MLSLEKVIKGFEYCYCTKAETINCPGNCPYYAYDDCEKQVALDVLELLKEQEAIIEQYRRADGFLEAHGWKWEGR